MWRMKTFSCTTFYMYPRFVWAFVFFSSLFLLFSPTQSLSSHSVFVIQHPTLAVRCFKFAFVNISHRFSHASGRKRKRFPCTTYTIAITIRNSDSIAQHSTLTQKQQALPLRICYVWSTAMLVYLLVCSEFEKKLSIQSDTKLLFGTRKTLDVGFIVFVSCFVCEFSLFVCIEFKMESNHFDFAR